MILDNSEKHLENSIFTCDKCRQVFQLKSNLQNHTKICGGAAREGITKCINCTKEISKSNIARHLKKCQYQGVVALVRKTGPCPSCSRILSLKHVYAAVVKQKMRIHLDTLQSANSEGRRNFVGVESFDDDEGMKLIIFRVQASFA